MGYTTSFAGRFNLTPSLTHEQWCDLTELHDGNPHHGDGAPDSYCQWEPTRKGDAIEWDGGEKFYNYVEWLQWIINRRLKPWGVAISGEVSWQGEEHGDSGVLSIADGKVVASKLQRAGREVDEDVLLDALESLRPSEFVLRFKVTYR